MSKESQGPVLHAIAFDFDGCLLAREDSALDDNLRANNQKLYAAIKQQNQQFTRSIGLIGSSRQSNMIEVVNAKERAFCFPLMKPIIEQELGATFDPFLLADAYGKVADGESYRRAIENRDDDSQWFFDEYKASLVYTQAHHIANQARACDFMCLDTIPEDISTIPCQSNAAYVYSQGTLVYINKLEGTTTVCDITNTDLCDSFAEQYSNATLTDDQLQEITEFTSTEHQPKDYPIVFDFYDDRDDILQELKKTFEACPHLLPKNLILRLYQYPKTEKTAELDCYASIVGTGLLDRDPNKTVVAMAKAISGDETLDYTQVQSNFGAYMKKNNKDALFTNRTLITPTVSIDPRYKTEEQPRDYLSSLAIEDLQAIRTLRDTLVKEKSYFNQTLFASKTSHKSLKIMALNNLLQYAQTMPPKEAIEQVIITHQNDPSIYSGNIWHRTFDLITSLATKYEVTTPLFAEPQSPDNP